MAVETRFSVRLYGEVVGELVARGLLATFVLSDDYIRSSDRSVLGLQFEDNLAGRWTGQGRLPAWFANLLPEGRLREMIDQALGLSADEAAGLEGQLRVMQILGADLPGAVTIGLQSVSDVQATEESVITLAGTRSEVAEILRFSVAGVGLKFSMLRQGAQFVVPVAGAAGDWIVKFPDPTFKELPSNEYAIMELARRVGLVVPDIALVARDGIEGAPDQAWGNESLAFAIKRFDRSATGSVHTEDLAQVRGFFPSEKYRGTYESAASYVYRNHELSALIEFVKRLAFSVIIGNSDLHLKNISMIYLDRRRATLAPAYDLVSAAGYPGSRLSTDLALKFRGTKSASSVGLDTFAWLASKLAVDRDVLVDSVNLVVRETLAGLSGLREHVDHEMFSAIASHAEARAAQFGIR